MIALTSFLPVTKLLSLLHIHHHVHSNPIVKPNRSSSTQKKSGSPLLFSVIPDYFDEIGELDIMPQNNLGVKPYIFSLIFSIKVTSAGSHSTSPICSLVSHFAFSCSFNTRSPLNISHQKQSIER